MKKFCYTNYRKKERRKNNDYHNFKGNHGNNDD